MLTVRDYMTPDIFVAQAQDGAKETFGAMRVSKIRHMPVLDESGVIIGIVSDRDLRRPAWVDSHVEAGEAYNLTDDIKVMDVMTGSVIAIREDEPLTKAALLFNEFQYGALPVVDHDGELVGILSPIDLCRALADVLAATSAS